MKPVSGLPLSIQEQTASKDLSKRPHEGAKRPTDNIYARLRRLEQEIELLRLKVGNCHRDVLRIEKRQYRAEVPASTTSTLESVIGGFLG